MKAKLPKNLIKYRVDLPGYVQPPERSMEGFFVMNYANTELRVMSGIGHGWDHVSVSVAGRTPTWEEMDWVRGLFYRDDETVIQFHPPRALHINFHKHTLHMWGAWYQKFELPPHWMIAPIKDQISKGFSSKPK